MDDTKLVSDLRAAFTRGKTRDIGWRIRQLKALKRMLEENEQVFCECLHKDLRKSRFEALGTEIDPVTNEIISQLRGVKKWTQDQPVGKTVTSLLDHASVRPEAYGVVLIIGAWNYPLHLSLLPLCGAIAAGNCALVKPSEVSPHIAQCIEAILPKYLDKECFKVVNGGVPETTALLKNKFDYIFYTGSPMVGKIIGAAANAHLTPCTLELGGKSPAYVDDSANLEVVAKRLLWGKAVNAGQTCIAPDYVLCSKPTEVELLRQMQKLITAWYGERPQSSPDLGRIVNERHFDRIIKLLTTCTGHVAFGGSYDKSDLFIGLTVLTDVSTEDPIMQEEIFGPLLPIVTTNSTQEAIDFINQREKPLVFYAFSENTKVQEALISGTSSGTIVVNDCLLQLSIETLPFGGVGNSGIGKYHGKASFDTFSHYKSIFMRDLGRVGEFAGASRYPPYTSSKEKRSRMLLRSRKIPSLGFVGFVITFLLGVLASPLTMFFRWMSQKAE